MMRIVDQLTITQIETAMSSHADENAETLPVVESLNSGSVTSRQDVNCEQKQVIDLPYQNKPRGVINVEKAAVRHPDVLEDFSEQ